MKCVVCDERIVEGREEYANAWERVRKNSPCCGAQCVGVFDPDKHWLPAVLPEAASDDEQHRLLPVVRQRLRDGDSPTVVLREMLFAGISPMALRKQLNEALVASGSAHKTARQLSVIDLLTGAFVARKTDKRTPAKLEEALADLGRWEARVVELEEKNRDRSSQELRTWEDRRTIQAWTARRRSNRRPWFPGTAPA